MIQFFNRKTKKMETEKVYGDAMVNFSYKNKFGLFLSNAFLSKKIVSQAMGWYQNSKASAKAIPEFTELYKIPMHEYEEKKYESFNDFFIRKFKPGLRNFNSDPAIFCAGAEARYLAVENIQEDTLFPVKGIHLNLSSLLASAELAKEFIGGTLIIARLCPVDYHRFHFPISGTLLSTRIAHGSLHSVNPVALEVMPSLLFKNERQIAVIQNELFGKVAMIEVGAMGVGKIVQSAYPENEHQRPEKPIKFEKGDEKGYFLFGGSTVIWVLQFNQLNLDTDLSKNSGQGIETWVPLGDRLGERKQGALHSRATAD